MICTLWVESKRRLREVCGGEIDTTGRGVEEVRECRKCGARWTSDGK